MGPFASQFSRIYVSDGAFTAAVLLVLGLLGTTTGLWLHVMY